MMTPLEHELLQAAALARGAGLDPNVLGTTHGPAVLALAGQLQQRAAWVRERDPGPGWPSSALYQSLTGPIPSETAPAVAAATDETFKRDAGLLRRLADSPRETPVQEAARMWRASETAPAAPCETCKGAREVLFFYERGPGDMPGNQMIPCPTCRPAAPKEGTGET